LGSLGGFGLPDPSSSRSKPHETEPNPIGGFVWNEARRSSTRLWLCLAQSQAGVGGFVRHLGESSAWVRSAQARDPPLGLVRRKDTAEGWLTWARREGVGRIEEPPDTIAIAARLVPQFLARSPPPECFEPGAARDSEGPATGRDPSPSDPGASRRAGRPPPLPFGIETDAPRDPAGSPRGVRQLLWSS